MDTNILYQIAYHILVDEGSADVTVLETNETTTIKHMD